METKLNQLLADFVVEYHKLQTFLFPIIRNERILEYVFQSSCL